MRRCQPLLLALALALLALIPGEPVSAQSDDLKKAELAHFRFNGNANDESGKRAAAELKNTEFRDNVDGSRLSAFGCRPAKPVSFLADSR